MLNYALNAAPHVKTLKQYQCKNKSKPHQIQPKFNQTKLRNLLIYQNIPHKFFFSPTFNYFFCNPKIKNSYKSKGVILRIVKYLEDVSKRNPFNTKYFMWLDSSISRFFGNLEITDVFPNSEKLEDGKLNIQSSLTRLKNVIKPRNDKFIMKSISHDFNAYLFGGTSDIIEFFSNKQDEIVDYMLENKVINTEEVAFSIIYKEHPDKFKIHNFGVGRPQEIQFLKYLNILNEKNIS